MSSETSWRTLPAPFRVGRRPEALGAHGLRAALPQAI
jgi:hypothetical protein